MPLKSKAFRRQRTAHLAGEKCADIAALAQNAINVSESVGVIPFFAASVAFTKQVS